MYNKHTGWIVINENWAIRFEQKWGDMWIGIYWQKTLGGLDIWLCILPTLPIHIRKHMIRRVK